MNGITCRARGFTVLRVVGSRKIGIFFVIFFVIMNKIACGIIRCVVYSSKKRFTLHRICAHIYIYTYKDNATRHSRVCKPCQYIYSAAPAPSIGPFFVLQLVCKFFWMENCVVGFMFSWLRLAPFGIWQTVWDRQGAHYFQFWKTVVQTALSRTATA